VHLVVQQIAEMPHVKHHLVEDPGVLRGIDDAVAQSLDDQPQRGHRIAQLVRAGCVRLACIVGYRCRHCRRSCWIRARAQRGSLPNARKRRLPAASACAAPDADVEHLRARHIRSTHARTRPARR